MRFLKSEADSVALSLFSVKYFIFKCFLFLCGYCGPPCNFCVLSLFSIFSPHEFLCPLSGAAVWTRLIMLAWTNNDTLMWWLLVQVTKVLLCALQLIIEAWLPLPQLRALGVSCPISPSWYEHEHCLYTNMRTEYEYGYWDVDCYERSLCLFLHVWAGEWLTSYTCTDPGLMLAPKHRRWGHCYCGQCIDIMMYVGYRDLVDIGKRALHLQISINNQNLPPARFVRFWQENWFIASAFLLRHMNLSRSMLPDISCTLYLQ